MSDARETGSAEPADPRATGTRYHWVLFNWPLYSRDRRANWEPASYDPRTQTWLLIGSREQIPIGHPCILQVGDEMVRPPQPARASEPRESDRGNLRIIPPRERARGEGLT